MCSSFWQLGVESRDFSHAEKEKSACKAGQINKMTTIFPQNNNLGPFLEEVLFFSAIEKSRDSTPNRLKLEVM